MEKKNKGDQNKAWGKVVAKAWTDEVFKQKLLKHPKEALQEQGVKFKDNVKNVKVYENTKDTIHLVIPAKQEGMSEDEIARLTGGSLGPDTVITAGW